MLIVLTVVRHVLFERQVERLRSNAVELFRERASVLLRDTVSAPAQLAREFTAHVETAQKEALSFFLDKVKASVLPDDTVVAWNYASPLEELHTSIAAETDHLRKDLLQLLMTNVKDELEVNLRLVFFSPLPLLPCLSNISLVECPYHAHSNKLPTTCGPLSEDTLMQPSRIPWPNSSPASRPLPPQPPTHPLHAPPFVVVQVQQAMKWSESIWTKYEPMDWQWSRSAQRTLLSILADLCNPSSMLCLTLMPTNSPEGGLAEMTSLQYPSE